MGLVQRLRSSRSGDRLAIWRMTHPGPSPGWSVLGAILAIGLVLVAWSVQRRTGASSAPVVMLVASASAALLVASFVSHINRALVPLAIAIAISFVAYGARTDLLGGPLSGPLGYRNALGALFLQGGFAWMLAGLAIRTRPAFAVSLVGASLLGVLAISSSAGTAIGGALVGVVVLAKLGRRGARIAISLCGLASATVLAATIWLGAAHDPGRPPAGISARVADAGITERRLALWHDALAIAMEHPAGIGHGRFGTASVTARADSDAMYAHNEFLEQAAELGWAGMVLTSLLVAWAFVRLAVNPRADVVTVMAAVALAGLSIHASIDFVWHFPAVPLAVAGLIGTGIATHATVAEHTEGRLAAPKIASSPSLTRST